MDSSCVWKENNNKKLPFSCGISCFPWNFLTRSTCVCLCNMYVCIFERWMSCYSIYIRCVQIYTVNNLVNSPLFLYTTHFSSDYSQIKRWQHGIHLYHHCCSRSLNLIITKLNWNLPKNEIKKTEKRTKFNNKNRGSEVTNSIKKIERVCGLFEILIR